MDERGNKEWLPDFCTKRVLILGCGNRLFGDDGFGSVVAERLGEYRTLPEDVSVIDVGTGVRKLLFTLSLSEKVPESIIIIDAVDMGRNPGAIFEISADSLPREKADDFSLHQAPSLNLLKELEERGINVKVYACQVESVPDAVRPGLSQLVANAIPQMCEMLWRICHKSTAQRPVNSDA